MPRSAAQQHRPAPGVGDGGGARGSPRTRPAAWRGWEVTCDGLHHGDGSSTPAGDDRCWPTTPLTRARTATMLRDLLE